MDLGTYKTDSANEVRLVPYFESNAQAIISMLHQVVGDFINFLIFYDILYVTAEDEEAYA